MATSEPELEKPSGGITPPLFVAAVCSFREQCTTHLLGPFAALGAAFGEAFVCMGTSATPIAVARANILSRARELGAKMLLMVDDDVVFTPEALSALLRFIGDQEHLQNPRRPCAGHPLRPPRALLLPGPTRQGRRALNGMSVVVLPVQECLPEWFAEESNENYGEDVRFWRKFERAGLEKVLGPSVFEMRNVPVRCSDEDHGA